MPRTGIVTDSTADLSADTSDRFDIGVVPLVVNWEGQTYRDKVDLTTAEFYRRLRISRTLPTTGAPSLAAFEEVYRAALERYDGLVSVHLSGKLSGTYDVAKSAAEAVDPGRIRVIDSGTVSICLGWLAEIGAQLGQEGAAPQEVAQTLEQMAGRLRVYFVLDTLEFLQRGGRIGRAMALAGTLLNVKPILAIQEGVVHPVERVRTHSASLRRLVEIITRLGPVERIGVVHGDAPEGAEELRRQLEPHYPGSTIGHGEIGSVLGTHAGPGLVGAGLLLAG